MSNKGWLRLFRVVEEVAWVGGFILVAAQTSAWVSIGISAMLLGYGLSRTRKANTPNKLKALEALDE